MNIDALNLAEQLLLSRVDQATGLMEEKHEQLLQRGVFGEYRKIYEEYVDLIESQAEGLEALKRATFLHWYQMAEPSCFSGLYALPENASRRVLGALERKIESEAMDAELRWMLPYYHEIAEWAFSSYSGLPNLKAFLGKVDRELLQKVDLRVEDFLNRGQMGDYWVSIINPNVSRFGEGAI